jgi:DNA polymerase III alpha subunit (gram-positive type)
MNNNIFFLKKLNLFSFYKKVLKENRNEIEQSFGLRIDKAQRMYTVLNIPEEIIGDAFSLKKSDIDRISENYIKEYTSEITRFLTSKGLGELLSFYEVKKVDKYSYLVVLGYSLFRSNEYYDKLYWRVYPVIGILTLIGSFLLFF